MTVPYFDFEAVTWNKAHKWNVSLDEPGSD